MNIALTQAQDNLATLLARHSVTLLRIALGTVFLSFGALKFVPGASPAAEIAQETIGTLTFGLVGPTAALLLTAAMECFIGLTLITGVGLRLGLIVLGAAMIGIMSPLVLFTDELFGDGVSLMGQYVFKDIILVTAALVVGAHSLGARLRTTAPSLPAHRTSVVAHP